MNRSLKFALPLLAALILTPVVWWLWTKTTALPTTPSKASTLQKPSSNEVLARAAKLDPSRDHDAFRLALQSVAPTFQEIQPDTTFGQTQWHHITLNKSGVKVDAIRFTVPADQNRDLYFGFISPKSVHKQWGIKAFTGSIKGMNSFQKSDLESYVNLPHPTYNASLIIQAYPANPLTAGRDYLIWFKFTTSKPVDMYVALNLSLPQKDASVSDALGLK